MEHPTYAPDEPKEFTAWWGSLESAPDYPGIKRRIALNAWRAALIETQRSRADAERYHFLRDVMHPGEIEHMAHSKGPAEWDALIDAAMMEDII